MTFGALAGVVLTLAVVLGLMAVALRLVRRLAGGTAGGRGRVPLEVVQRLALGPKQGIAVVRIGERLLAVSLGEGGIRPLAELGEAERALLAAGPAHAASDGAGLGTVRGLAGRMAALVRPPATPAAAPLAFAGAAPDTDGAAGAGRVMARRAALLSPLPPVAVVPETPAAAARGPVAAPERGPAGTAQAPFHALLQTALRGGAAALLLAAALGTAGAG
ncbi:MAG TPA: flagellar biosynthetic protein FliO, partial [Gemmatimonadaceae bacterium]